MIGDLKKILTPAKRRLGFSHRRNGMKTAILAAATFAIACACAARAQQLPEARAENPDASGNSNPGARIKDALQNKDRKSTRLNFSH